MSSGCQPTGVLQSGLSLSSVLIRQICPGVLRAPRRVVGRVPQRAAVGSGREGPVMLQAVERVLAVAQARGGLLVARGGLLVARVAELQKRRPGRVGRD